MEFMQWTSETEMGIGPIDYQHKNLCKFISDFYSSYEVLTNQKCVEFLSQLINHLDEHFKTEENYMKEYSDPGYISHKLEHERLTKKITDLLSSIEEKKEIISKDFLISMKIWFYNHYKFKDKKLGDHIQTSGISS
jgi:hemerythrin-like metal-binding protein